MSRERGMFRVYVCPKCRNVDYVCVEGEAEPSKCSKCDYTIVDTPGMIYAVTVQEAEENVQELAQIIEVQSRVRRISRGRGVKRRVQDIITTLVEMNHGRPVLFSRVLQECIDAGIEVSRAVHFITLLESEGRISSDGIVVEIKEEY
ncbi:MAG: hypothetical protein ACTSYL_08795 [Candidatus Thorarchaeota archaeon]